MVCPWARCQPAGNRLHAPSARAALDEDTAIGEMLLLRLPPAAKRVDAELLYQSEHGVEVRFLLEGVIAYAHRWPLRAQAVQEADEQRARLLREGWTVPAST